MTLGPICVSYDGVGWDCKLTVTPKQSQEPILTVCKPIIKLMELTKRVRQAK